MTEKVHAEALRGAAGKGTFLRLAVPTLKGSTSNAPRVLSEKLSVSHMRALFADDLRKKPLMSRMRRAIRAPGDSNVRAKSG